MSAHGWQLILVSYLYVKYNTVNALVLVLALTTEVIKIAVGTARVDFGP